MTSLEYWKERERAAAEEYAVTDEQALARTREIYTRLVASIDERINAFYARYAASEGLSMNLAEMAVSQFDVKAFEATAAKLVADRDFSAQANAQLKIYNATMRINRLEMLKAYIGLDLLEAGDDIVRLDERYLTERSREEFERQAGILGESIRHTTDDVKAIVNSSFYNATFSQRIWANVSELQNRLSEIITNGIIQGINPRQMTGRLRERFAVSESDAERLLRTELARVQTETQRQSFERMGFDAYVFISLEGAACPVCAALDTGEPIPLEDFMPGETAPPIHPNCRCSVAAWMDREEMERELGFALDEEEVEAAPVPQEPDEKFEQIKQYLIKSRVAHNPVTRLHSEETEEELIDRLGGGDKTGGSCVSLSLAYAGRKAGFDVLDFRGGNSEDAFSRVSNVSTIAQMRGVVSYITKNTNDIKATLEIIKQLQEGREYILSTGSHAAVIRQIDGKWNYLELQSENENGFHRLTTDLLRARFGARKSHTVAGRKYEKTTLAIDIDSLIGNNNFEDILGYLNTQENAQKKGIGGYAK